LGKVGKFHFSERVGTLSIAEPQQALTLESKSQRSRAHSYQTHSRHGCASGLLGFLVALTVMTGWQEGHHKSVRLTSMPTGVLGHYFTAEVNKLPPLWAKC